MLVNVKTRERICELKGSEYILNPCPQLDAQLFAGLDLEVISILDDKFSVTQSLLGDYHYVKWWDGRQIFVSLI